MSTITVQYPSPNTVCISSPALPVASVCITFRKEPLAGAAVTNCIPECVQAHSAHGDNYSWLNAEYGEVMGIAFEEPVLPKYKSGQQEYDPSTNELVGNWKPYTDDIWAIHCKVIDHEPAHLTAAHVQAFIEPSTRFARLRFTFRRPDGMLYQMEPTSKFYELEASYFADNNLCLS